MTRWLCTHLDARGRPCNHETTVPLTECHLHGEDREPEPITEPCRACERPARAGGYCDTHFRQAKRGEVKAIRRHPRQAEVAA